ncbi:MAG: hypothetical protein WKG01_15330 [Kofleriaceae bacterium]
MMITRRAWLAVALVFGFGSSPALAQKATANADLALLPVDSELVLGLNFAQLQQSSLWKQFVQPMMMQGDTQKKLAEFTALCGFDPMQAVKTMTIGMKGLDDSSGQKPDGVIVAHGMDKAKMTTCIDKVKASGKKGAEEITRDGDTFTVKSKDGETVMFTFSNASTAVIVIGPKATKDGIKTVMKGGSKLATSAAFLDMYKRTNTADTVWMLINGNSAAFNKLGAMGMKPKAVFGSINVTKDLTAALRLRLASADEAKSMQKQLAPMVQQAAAMFDKLAVSSEAADLKINISLSNQTLRALVKRAGGRAGGAPPSPGAPAPAPAPKALPPAKKP